jgi:aromatic-L-amino-acid/L-tryptophan decarboxylase
MSLSSYAELRRAGHRMVDLLVDYWEGVAARRVAPEEELSRIFARFADTLGDEGVGLDSTVAELGMVLDASMAMSHPLYLGLVNSSPLPEAALADLVVSALDNNGGASHQGPAQAAAEREVIRWLADRLGYAGDGIILPGGSYAMVQALHLAKARQFPHWLQGGPHRLDGEPRVYTSAATHFSVTRAAHVIGLGDAGLVRVAFASRGAMCPAALEAALRQDRAAGRCPLAVVATVGSTGTGAIDPLTELAELCDEFGVWFHVDACYGGAAALLAGEHVLRAGLQRADSLCMDLHKWFFMPLTAGILLTRHADLVRQTFDVAASYIPVTDMVEAYCRGVPTSRAVLRPIEILGCQRAGGGRPVRSNSHGPACFRPSDPSHPTRKSSLDKALGVPGGVFGRVLN